ncbi:hypothetical protein Dsin_007928 [Dipteronia sinensis]|uniref:Uncharacterized protein n=1 Tax=Dipteronia sinensis TaxID=43782 RepID=A0AAE0EH25_9ROSI|nr:hypothetical protein Dsin_007928 [Dipteronia sinensis]
MVLNINLIKGHSRFVGRTLLVRNNNFFFSGARRSRLKRVKEGLETSLRGLIELIDSYARVCYSALASVRFFYPLMCANEIVEQSDISNGRKALQNRWSKSWNWKILKRHAFFTWKLESFSFFGTELIH